MGRPSKAANHRDPNWRRAQKKREQMQTAYAAKKAAEAAAKALLGVAAAAAAPPAAPAPAPQPPPAAAHRAQPQARSGAHGAGACAETPALLRAPLVSPVGEGQDGSGGRGAESV